MPKKSPIRSTVSEIVKKPWLVNYYNPPDGSRFTPLRTMYEEQQKAQPKDSVEA